MPKHARSLQLTLHQKPPHVSLTRWLYQELREAILDGRLKPGMLLPPTRDFALEYQISRGTVVTVFEQLQAEGYVVGRVGAGTQINERLSQDVLWRRASGARMRKVPAPIRGLPTSHPARPFRAYEPALNEFPTDIWSRVAGRRLRRASPALLGAGDPRGYAPLREALAAYLGSSRGVNCSADNVVILSGVQQGLDLLVRVLVKPGESVWMEEPGYFGAAAAFRTVGARIIPVPVDEYGLVVSKGQLLNPAKAVYVTPAHQFPLGVTMTLERRLELLAWAGPAGAIVIEDDYDSEYRFEGKPIPALQALDKTGSVILLGSFSKVLFPALRLGYVVVPSELLDRVLALRISVDLFPSDLNQAILCDFMVEGHLSRHIRRMRDMYATRLAALRAAAQKYVAGLIEISAVQAGLSTAGFLRNGMTSRQAEKIATEFGIEVLGLHRFKIGTIHSVEGLLLGFAAFTEDQITQGVVALAAALGSSRCSNRRRVRSQSVEQS
jgi:GntR family transcriptional regulator / MocR family aminotransferase